MQKTESTKEKKTGSGPPLPDKLPTEGKDPRSRAAGYAYGWNDCLEEIKRRLHYLYLSI